MRIRYTNNSQDWPAEPGYDTAASDRRVNGRYCRTGAVPPPPPGDGRAAGGGRTGPPLRTPTDLTSHSEGRILDRGRPQQAAGVRKKRPCPVRLAGVPPTLPTIVSRHRVAPPPPPARSDVVFLLISPTDRPSRPVSCSR